MTNPMINPQQPNYSGVTIQISNPAVNLGGEKNCTVPNVPQGCQGVYQIPQTQLGSIPQKEIYGYATNPQMAQQPNGFQSYPPQ